MPKRYNNYEGKSVNNKTGYAEIKNEETQSYTIENILAYNRDLEASFGFDSFVCLLHVRNINVRKLWPANLLMTTSSGITWVVRKHLA